MYKNLNAASLGVSARQNELIELTLTYGFRGFDLDFSDFIKRTKTQGIEEARQFLESAKITIGGFELPIDWCGEKEAYEAELAKLEELAAIAASVGATRCFATVSPTSETLPYHENFELHRQRLSEICKVLDKHGIQLGLGFLAAASLRDEAAYQFIQQSDDLLTLIKTIGAANLGLALDVWNWHVGGGNLESLRQLEGQQIIVVRLADAAAEASLESLEETQRLLPFEGGAFDNVGVLSFLADIEYDGPIAVYPHPDQFTGVARDAKVQSASSAMDELWKAAGLNKAGKRVETCT